jgi:hypothetical protein
VNFDESFSNTSFAMLFLIAVLIVLVAVEMGLRFGCWSRSRKKSETDAPIGTMVGAMLGLLAFMMAFTFQMAAQQYDARRMLVLKESNAIGTAYLRADFIPEPGRTEVRGLLREYVSTRLDATKLEKFEAAISRSEQILDSLWAHVSIWADKNAGTPLTALFAAALNEVIDLHSERLTVALRFRIPVIIWAALLFVTFFSMLAVGYQFGIDGTRSVLGTLVIAFTFSTVIVLIADLDNPRKGLITTNQWSMVELQKNLNKGNAERLPVGGPSETKGALS